MAPHSPYASTPRVRSSGAASQLDPSPRSSRVSPTGSAAGRSRVRSPTRSSSSPAMTRRSSPARPSWSTPADLSC